MSKCSNVTFSVDVSIARQHFVIIRAKTLLSSSLSVMRPVDYFLKIFLFCWDVIVSLIKHWIEREIEFAITIRLQNLGTGTYRGGIQLEVIASGNGQMTRFVIQKHLLSQATTAANRLNKKKLWEGDLSDEQTTQRWNKAPATSPFSRQSPNYLLRRKSNFQSQEETKLGPVHLPTPLLSKTICNDTTTAMDVMGHQLQPKRTLFLMSLKTERDF